MDDDELSEKIAVKSENYDNFLISGYEVQSNINKKDETKKEKNTNKSKINNKDSLISCEIDIETIQNPLFNSMKSKSEKRDDKKPKR